MLVLLVVSSFSVAISQAHKSFHAIFGPDAASQLMGVVVPLPASWTQLEFRSYTVGELLQAALRLEQRLRRQIDHCVLLYYKHVLLPAREIVDVLAAPLQQDFVPRRMQQKMQWSADTHTHTRGAQAQAQNSPHGGTPEAQPLFVIEHSLNGYMKLVQHLPEMLKSAYDTAFDTFYLLLHYLIQGKPHPALSDRDVDYHDVLQLREELLLVILLCVVFCALLSFKVLRRRLNEAVQQQQQQ